MSHAPARKEKDCLNCGAIVQGRFCHVCGQENIVPHESFFSMVHHFFADITHFDGKFFSTVGILIRKPGFLSSEYVKGRRNSYLNPVRMYVFTSALFFLIFFILVNPHKLKINIPKGKKGISRVTADLLKEGYKNVNTREDSLAIEKALKALNDSLAQKDTGAKVKAQDDGVLRMSFGPVDSNYSTVAEYDSFQTTLPPAKKDGWFIRGLQQKRLGLRELYEENEAEFWMNLLAKFVHSFPYMLFVSLPLYALFLKLFYLRRKQFYYADHGLFLIHLYIFTFIVLLLFFGVDTLKNYAHLAWLDFAEAGLIIFGLIYALLAMKFFYKQGWIKTILKFILFNIVCVFALLILFVVFFAFSAFLL
jgi:hypothetical protein